VRNKSEDKPILPPLPPSYDWLMIHGRPQVWHKGLCQFWVPPSEARSREDLAAMAWLKWESDSGLTRERYLELLNFEHRCLDDEECQTCVEREESETSMALEAALW
jgi:hypothetical protein